MEIKGKIVMVLPLQQGEGKNGPWKKQEYVIETSDKFPRKICFSLWGEKVDQFDLREGEDVDVMFDLESREFNSRWYTDVKAWKIVKSIGESIPPHEDGSSSNNFELDDRMLSGEGIDGLPF
jgi:hypothetical protein